jgi:hypothetical protein
MARYFHQILDEIIGRAQDRIVRLQKEHEASLAANPDLSDEEISRMKEGLKTLLHEEEEMIEACSALKKEQGHIELGV